ncbi:hypothetical protein [Bacillus tuaregi]|uniref:hypothetical protein n=1 Tax=Bacillus tuaregi TaxID=1816695 RepID=UPI0008F7EBDC|nr:hypothetical protein [Bacillus tuaregi]
MKRLLLTPGLFLTSILSSCYRDSMREEIHSYLQEELAEISHLEKEAIAAFERVTGDHYTTDQELYNTLIYEVIPVYEIFLQQLERVELTSFRLQKIHEDCLNGVNLQYQAFASIAGALEDLDKGKMVKANSLLTDACKLIVCPYVYI